MLKFTEQRKTPGMTSKKTLLSLKGKSRFCVNLDETKADMVQFTKRWNKKECKEKVPDVSRSHSKLKFT